MDLSVVPPSKAPAGPTTTALPIATQPPPTAAPEARPQLREGFWFNVGFGYGSLGCEDCRDRLNGFSGGLSLGGTIGTERCWGSGPLASISRETSRRSR